MKRDTRFLWGAIVVGLVCFGIAFGLNVFYNEAHEARGLDRTTFQVLVLAMFSLALLAVLAATWFTTKGQDEVVRAADRISMYWGWAIGTCVWLMTPWLTSLPQVLVDPMSNPNGNTLFTLSEAAGAYMGGGVVLILIVSVCSMIIKLGIGWWLARQSR